MKYIGLYSGKIYYKKKDAEDSGEYCHHIQDGDMLIHNKEYRDAWHLERLKFCVECCSCPKAKGNIYDDKK